MTNIKWCYQNKNVWCDRQALFLFAFFSVRGFGREEQIFFKCHEISFCQLPGTIIKIQREEQPMTGFCSAVSMSSSGSLDYGLSAAVLYVQAPKTQGHPRD